MCRNILASPDISEIHAQIQEFSSGGPGQSDRKKSSGVFVFCFFLVLSLFYRSRMVNFKISIIFQGSRGGPTFSRGVQLFAGGGVQLLILYKSW